MQKDSKDFEDHFLSKRVGISFGDIEEPFLTKSKVKALCKEILFEAFSLMVEKGYKREEVEIIASDFFASKFGPEEKPTRKTRGKKERVP